MLIAIVIPQAGRSSLRRAKDTLFWDAAAKAMSKGKGKGPKPPHPRNLHARDAATPTCADIARPQHASERRLTARLRLPHTRHAHDEVRQASRVHFRALRAHNSASVAARCAFSSSFIRRLHPTRIQSEPSIFPSSLVRRRRLAAENAGSRHCSRLPRRFATW